MNKIMLLIKMLLVTAVFAACLPGVVWSVPVYNAVGDGSFYDTYSDGSSYGTYTNSGSLLFVESGNNNGAFFDDLLGIMRYGNDNGFDGFGAGFELNVTDSMEVAEYDVEEDSGRTGTWAVAPPVTSLNFYAVKAGDAYAMYWVDPAEATGSWSTFDIWSSGLPGTGGLGGLEISHVTGYNPVPEPASMLLLGVGLAGIAGVTRGRMKKRRS